MFRRHDHGEGGERRGPRFIGRAVLGIVVAVAFALVFGIFLLILAFKLHSKKEEREHKAPVGAAAKKA